MEACGIALLMVVLLKHFAVEVCRIPTTSMQPTVMGSAHAGVHDRLLVDKLCYCLSEPTRWDIVAFKYPLRETRSYLKRIVGLGGERLLLAGGNVYTVGGATRDGETERLRILRKPPSVQEALWKEVFPARAHLDGERAILDRYFTGGGGGQWTEQEGVLRFAPRDTSSEATLTFGPDGLTDELWDGYPPEVARAIRDRAPHSMGWRQVQDARFSLVLTTSTRPERISIGVDVARASVGRARFAFHWEAGTGRLEVIAGGQIAASTGPFEISIEGGVPRAFRLAHCDDLLTLETDGREAARLECSGHEILEEPELVTLSVCADGGGELRFADLVVERDLHYLTSNGPADVISVPPGHFFVLGDNTHESADSRDWTEIIVGVLDGRVVDPRRRPEARLLAGDFEPVRLDREPALEENPIPVTGRGKIVFADRAGEVRVLDARVSAGDEADGHVWGQDGAWLLDEAGHAWHPATAPVRFVPREHVIGRPLLRVWPLLGPCRLGLVR